MENCRTKFEQRTSPGTSLKVLYESHPNKSAMPQNKSHSYLLQTEFIYHTRQREDQIGLDVFEMYVFGEKDVRNICLAAVPTTGFSKNFSLRSKSRVS